MFYYVVLVMRGGGLQFTHTKKKKGKTKITCKLGGGGGASIYTHTQKKGKTKITCKLRLNNI